MKERKIIIKRLDHLVLTITDLQKSIHFYTEILGMELITFGKNRKALKFGCQKINLHVKGKEIEPKAKNALSGTADLCLITSTPIKDVEKLLIQKNWTICKGIVNRTGALGSIRSIYIRDPDKNLIEISSYNL